MQPLPKKGSSPKPEGGSLSQNGAPHGASPAWAERAWRSLRSSADPRGAEGCFLGLVCGLKAGAAVVQRISDAEQQPIDKQDGLGSGKI